MQGHSPKAPPSNKNLGVLYTGYLDKRNPVTGSYKKRFVVLTHESFHWFKRAEGYDLFGEERGNVPLGNIIVTRILDENSNIFEVQGVDSKKRLFRGSSPVVSEEWVSAIRSAIKVCTSSALKQKSSDHETEESSVMTGNKRIITRRATLSNIRNIFETGDECSIGEDDSKNELEQPEVTVLMVALKCESKGSEVVLARSVNWNTSIDIKGIEEGDSVIISTSNGGTVVLPYRMLIEKADDEIEFELAVQNVLLASSLRLSLNRLNPPHGHHLGTAEERAPARLSIANTQPTEVKRGWWASMNAAEKGGATNLLLAVLLFLFASGRAVLVLSTQALLLTSVGTDTYAMLVVAAVLAVYNGRLLLLEGKQKQLAASGAAAQQTIDAQQAAPRQLPASADVKLVLYGHAFTSPDAPIIELDDEIPKRFLDGCEGDEKEARRRWDLTRHWRETEGVNYILEKPQPNFQLIKSLYPHYHAGRGKEGHLVFYERPGDFKGKELAAMGIKTEQLVQHWLFITEYQWEVMLSGDPVAKSISVIDLKGLSLTDLAGETMNYIKTTIGYANAHYPERSKVIFLVNAPWYCAAGWKLVKPLIHPNTQKKVKILNAKETLAGMQEHIDIESIPEYYGGQLDFGGHDSCRFSSPEVLALNDFVQQLNERHSVTTKTLSGSPTHSPSAAVPLTTVSSISDDSTGLHISHPEASQLPPHPPQKVQKPTMVAMETNRRLSGGTSTNLHFSQDHRNADEEWSIASNTTTASSSRSKSGSNNSSSVNNAAAVKALTGRSNGYNSYNDSNMYSHTRPVQVAPLASPLSTLSNSTSGRR